MTEKNVSPICIGLDNKDEIRKLENKIKLLELELTHVKSNMVKANELHEIKLEISELKGSLMEMQNNNAENRTMIQTLSTSVDELTTLIEEQFKSNAEVLANQIISQNEQKNFKKEQENFKEEQKSFSQDLKDVLIEIKKMNEKIESQSLLNQWKTFYNKSTFNKWVGRFAIVTLVILMISIFSFFTSGGETFFDILGQLKELIGWNI